MPELLHDLLAGNRHALARCVTAIENGDQVTRGLLPQIYLQSGHAHVVGVTGAPGVGKSTLITKLVLELRRRGKTVGVIAVDPTSPFTGGAILGDRIRMQELTGDDGVFIRSMASRGNLGGLSVTTRDVVRILDAAGFDVILIETVGIGQAETEIVKIAETVIVVTIPGMGDDIQAIKAGVLEIADIFVVNKVDRPGSEQAVTELRMMLTLGPRPKSEEEWRTPIIKAIAMKGEGMSDIVDTLAAHKKFVTQHRSPRETSAAIRNEIVELLKQRLQSKLEELVDDQEWAQIATTIAAHKNSPYQVEQELAAKLGLKL